MLSNWGAKGSEIGELKRFCEALASCDDITLVELTKRLKSADEGGSRANKGVARINDEAVDHYVRSFASLGLDRVGFMSKLSELEADKRIKAVEANALAKLVTKSEAKHRNKKAAVEAIATWIQRKFDTERRLGGTSDVF